MLTPLQLLQSCLQFSAGPLGLLCRGLSGQPGLTRVTKSPSRPGVTGRNFEAKKPHKPTLEPGRQMLTFCSASMPCPLRGFFCLTLLQHFVSSVCECRGADFTAEHSPLSPWGPSGCRSKDGCQEVTKALSHRTLSLESKILSFYELPLGTETSLLSCLRILSRVQLKKVENLPLRASFLPFP